MPPNGTVDTEDEKTQKTKQDRLAKMPWFAVGIFVLIAVGLSVAYGVIEPSRALAPAIALVGCASFGVGGIVGFLFGLPRAMRNRPVTPDAPTPASGDGKASGNGSGSSAGRVAAVAQARRASRDDEVRSTNLELVADWLTKILIGAGLVQLGNLGSGLASIGGYARTAWPDAPAVSLVAQLVVVIFAIGGFLTLYLWTRIHYTSIQTLADAALWRAVRALSEGLVEQGQQTQTVSRVMSMMAQGQVAIPDTPATSPPPPPSPPAPDGGGGGGGGGLPIPPVPPAVPAGGAGPDMPRAPEPAPAPPFVAQTSPQFPPWPPRAREVVEALMNEPPVWDSDPVHHLLPHARSAERGATLSGECTVVQQPGVVITLRVRFAAPDGTTVVFLLHPTFGTSRVRVVPIRQNEATLAFFAAEWFTAGALIPDHDIALRLDLRRIPGLPPSFFGSDALPEHARADGR